MNICGENQSGLPPVTLIGHPHLAIGRGEHIRAIWRALHSAGVDAKIYSVNQHPITTDPAFQAFGARRIPQLPGGLRLWHLNGNELANALTRLEERQPGAFAAGFNIVFPAWELPRFPDDWAQQVARFHEVWAASPFVRDSLRAAVRIPVRHIPNACEPHAASELPRAHFGLPEQRFLILFFFDLFSFATRKNPFAALETFRRFRAARPHADVQLVLKLHHSDKDPTVLPRLREAAADFGDRLTVIDGTLSDDETKNLVRNCDCFLSLHRSEGFGRGPAEAMFFGKPVVATGWSGNMEYMNPDVSFPVGYDLIPVKEGEYPAWQDQVWAEPKIDDAVAALVRLVDEPGLAKTMGERAREHMRANYSDVVLGQRYLECFREIAAAKG